MTDSTLAPEGSPERELLEQIDRERLPEHVAIIMDGNGRWAKQRRLPRVAGHRAGIKSVRETVEVAARLGLSRLTLYAFSRENWKRPRDEVSTLMSLLREFVRRELRTLVDNDIRLEVIGRVDDLADDVRADIDVALERTAGNGGMTLAIALSYGGRTELVDACRALIRDGIPADEVDETTLSERLYTAGSPDPDLLIRTSGEMRVSNFLLWQIAYAEIWVTDTLWPDFRRAELFRALIDYQKRERRYGGLSRVATR